MLGHRLIFIPPDCPLVDVEALLFETSGAVDPAPREELTFDDAFDLLGIPLAALCDFVSTAEDALRHRNLFANDHARLLTEFALASEALANLRALQTLAVSTWR